MALGVSSRRSSFTRAPPRYTRRRWVSVTAADGTVIEAARPTPRARPPTRRQALRCGPCGPLAGRADCVPTTRWLSPEPSTSTKSMHPVNAGAVATGSVHAFSHILWPSRPFPAPGCIWVATSGDTWRPTSTRPNSALLPRPHAQLARARERRHHVPVRVVDQAQGLALVVRLPGRATDTQAPLPPPPPLCSATEARRNAPSTPQPRCQRPTPVLLPALKRRSSTGTCPARWQCRRPTHRWSPPCPPQTPAPARQRTSAGTLFPPWRGRQSALDPAGARQAPPGRPPSRRPPPLAQTCPRTRWCARPIPGAGRGGEGEG